MLAETAVREVHEETGIRVSLGVPVGVSRYVTCLRRKQKVVHYWAAEATDDAIRASTFVPNREIAALEWVSVKKARARLSYPVDLEILDFFANLVDDGVLRTFPVVALRHAKALSALGVGRPGCRASADRARAEAGDIDRRPAARLRRAQDRHERRGAVRRRPSRPLAKALDRKMVEDGADQSGCLGGRRRRPPRRRRTPRALGKARRAVQPRTGAARHSSPRSPSRPAPIQGSYLSSAADLEPAAFSVVHLSATNPGSGIIAIETHIPKV